MTYLEKLIRLRKVNLTSTNVERVRLVLSELITLLIDNEEAAKKFYEEHHR